MTKPLSKTDKEILEMAKKNPEQFYKKTIDGLVQVHHEDRMAIFTLLSIVVAHMSDDDISEEVLKRHRMVVGSMFKDHEIRTIEDLGIKTQECVDLINMSRMDAMTPLGGIH